MTHYFPKRYARSLLRLIPEGSEADLLCAENCLSLESLEGEGLISVKKYCQLFNSIVRRLQISLHGNEANRYSQFGSYKLIVNAMVQAANLRDAIEIADALISRLLPESGGCPLQWDGQLAHWKFYMVNGNDGSEWPLMAFSMKEFHWGSGLIGHSTGMWLWHRIACWLIGVCFELEQVDVSDECPANPIHYYKLFNSTVNFQQRSCGIYFPVRYLDYSIIKNTERVAAMIENFPEDLFYVDQNYANTTARIRALIGSDFVRSVLTIEAVAKRMNISVATLQRRLQNEGTNFQKIKEDCRYRVARNYLKSKNLSINQISGLLGYSDISVFYRSFKKWTGMTPIKFREMQCIKSIDSAR